MGNFTHENFVLEIVDLHVQIEGKKILDGLSLGIKKGEMHAIMGPNGSGKSTLSLVIMGHPKYKILKGDILYKGKSIKGLPPDEIARLGLFLAFQYPVSITGVSVASFLRLAYTQKLSKEQAVQPNIKEFLAKLKAKTKELGLDQSFISRFVNEGCSGGEKKRLETLQMAMLEPEVAVLDETDSGLDIDALKLVAKSISNMRNNEKSFLVITHYQRLLDYLKPDKVSVLMGGRIIASGGPEFALKLEEKGYEWAAKEYVKV